MDQPTRPNDLSDFITQQLQAQGVRFKFGGSKDLQVYCPQGHDRKSASLLIRRSDGSFICFGSGIKGRNWNHLRRYLPGIEILPDELLPDDSDLAADLLRKQLTSVDAPVELLIEGTK